ncbi:MAG: ATP-dependent helicase HrpB [Arcanobacterium sp.]|nr:ATP-dependent helicase HrpB [Arcanobacterium sp.]
MSGIANLVASPPALPVVAGLEQMRAATQNFVVSAPPGSGKTTLVPPLLATLTPGKVLVVSPRRIVARANAQRVASLAGERVGESVGFRIRGESRIGSRIDFVTPGVLLRTMLRDPALEGVGAVVIDEFHERNLETDLATAFVLDTQSVLRPDLRVVLMSATLDAESTAELIDGKVVAVPGVLHTVHIEERVGPMALGATRSGAIVVKNDFLKHVAQVTREAAAALTNSAETTDASILVFVPGVREVAEVAGMLRGAPAIGPSGALPVLELHGRLNAREQDRALAGGAARIIVATAIAESALTVPGVRAVVDSGLSREPRFDAATGIGGLVTVHANRAAMIQRAGRAGRESTGIAYRCLSFARATEFGEPEIRIADVTGAALFAACWGAPRFAGLRLLSLPPTANMQAATATLQALGAIDSHSQATKRGHILAEIPAEPAIARALVDGAQQFGARTAAHVAAALSLDLRPDGADLLTALHSLRRAGKNAQVAGVNAGEFAREARRLEKFALRFIGENATSNNSESALSSTSSDIDEHLAGILSLAYPRWIARKRGTGYLTAGGVGAVLPQLSPLEGQEWLAVGKLQRGQGRSDAMIQAAAPISAALASTTAAALLSTHIETSRNGQSQINGGVRAWEVHTLGAIELERRSVPVSPEIVRTAWLADIQRAGLAALPWTDAARELRARLAFLHATLGNPWPDVSDKALLARLEEWLNIAAAAPDVATSLRNLLPWPEANEFNELAPEQIKTPIGHARVHYSSGRPIARMKLQEAFGWVDTPRVGGRAQVPITLELLSPAGRPLAVTSDLASFWSGPYAQVRAEMRGRYPRHPWPENPLDAQPTRKAKPKR